jgi:murein DD-endopeptidase MepM/ murein hydrolase activator NlpD
MSRILQLARFLFIGLLAVTLAACMSRPMQVGERAPQPLPPAPSREVPPGMVVVQPGETVYEVADRVKVPVRDLIDANGLQAPFQLRAGQELRIPLERSHVVASGETLGHIARRYGVDRFSLIQLNKLTNPDRIQVGQRLRLPVPVETVRGTQTAGVAPPSQSPAMPMPTTVAPPAPTANVPAQAPAAIKVGPSPSTVSLGPVVTPAPTAPVTAQKLPAIESLSPLAASKMPPTESKIVPTETATQAALTSPAPIESLAEPREAAPPPPLSGRGFDWPVRGRVVSAFGVKGKGLQNDGINIEAPRGTVVRAAEAGVVVYSGNELRGFGNLLLISHADGWMSAYAHNERLLVVRGATVRRGQPIAHVGATGNVSTPQIHFELRQNSRPVDPERYLVRGARAGVTPGENSDGRPDPG